MGQTRSTTTGDPCKTDLEGMKLIARLLRDFQNVLKITAWVAILGLNYTFENGGMPILND